MSPSNIEPQVAEIQRAVPAPQWAEAMLGNLDVAICHTDSRGYFLDVNEQYLALYGYTREEVIGKHFTLVVPEAYREVASQIHDGFIRGEAEAPAEWTVVNRAGQAIKVWVTPVRMVDDDDQPSKITLVEPVQD